MWRALTQWWRGTPRAADNPPVEQLRQARPAAAPGGPQPSDTDIARLFTATLLGAPALRDEAPTAAEQIVLKRLENAVRAGGEEQLVPRMPSVLPKLMRLLRRDDVAVHELIDLLEREPALLGEVMRVANSPLYAGTQTLTSLDAAIALLGQQGIQQVVTRAAMVPVFDLAQGRFGASSGTLLLDQANACAHDCAMRRIGFTDHFDAYLAGMVANTGLIVALRLFDQQQVTAAPVSFAFHDRLATLSAHVSAHIARQWRLSEAVAVAVESLAQPAQAEASGLAAALRLADQASTVQVLTR
ncbi:MAG TPA: HDOD domain-containing protein [Rhizobacter sp.]|nr:HDOD domain-containing protein [Rhizobacter sp.]